MKIDYSKLDNLTKKYGDAFYLLDSEQFEKNFHELKEEFSKLYPYFNIAYSYKTNYTPKLCKIIEANGGIAEVVSEMELEIALRIGVLPENIIWNGPCKNKEKVKDFLLMGGIVNIDSYEEFNYICLLIDDNKNKKFNIGIRCNFDVGDGVISRFGFDVNSPSFDKVISTLKKKKNVVLKSFQCHIATRSLETWRPRAENMLKLIEKYDIHPAYIDLGGGLYGKMADSLKKQFNSYIPTYSEYAKEVAPLFMEKFSKTDYHPTLLIEPGSALAGDSMKFVARVKDIKLIRGKPIATVLGSMYNINPTLNKKNPPIEVFSNKKGQKYEDLDFCGFTCIESDRLFRNYTGKLAVEDFVVFGNVGSYSVVLKPPFILPNFPVLDICNGEEVIKRGETFEDIFHTFKF